MGIPRYATLQRCITRMTQSGIYLLAVAPIQLGDQALEKRKELLERWYVGIDKFGLLPICRLCSGKFEDFPHDLFHRAVRRRGVHWRWERGEAIFKVRPHFVEHLFEDVIGDRLIADDAVDCTNHPERIVACRPGALEHPQWRPYVRWLDVADEVGAKPGPVIDGFREAPGLVQYPWPFTVFRGKTRDADLAARQRPRDFLQAATAFFDLRF